jgi:hypothetical protein
MWSSTISSKQYDFASCSRPARVSRAVGEKCCAADTAATTVTVSKLLPSSQLSALNHQLFTAIRQPLVFAWAT